MRWNGPTAIVIDVSPSGVTFNDPAGLSVVLAPIVYVAPDARRSRILAVGQLPASGGQTQRVEVFGPGRPPAGVSKLDCLTALFRHGMKEIMDRALFRVKPDVLVRGADSISPALAGYERDLFEVALQGAGAKRVRWSDDSTDE